MLTVTTPALTRRLTTEANVAADLGSQPVEVDALIDRVSAAIERYCGRVFAQQRYTEVLAAPRSSFLELARAPIISVASVIYDGTAITDYRIESADAGLLYRRGVSRFAQGWAQATDADYTVVYIAGYLLPGQVAATAPAPTGPRLPGDIEQAAIEAVKTWYHERDPSDRITSKTLGLTGDRIEYSLQSGRGAIPPLAKALLAPWRRVVLV